MVNIADHLKVILVGVDLLAIRIPNENVAIAAAGIKFLILIVENCAVNSVKMTSQSVRHFSTVHIDGSDVRSFRYKYDTVATAERRR